MARPPGVTPEEIEERRVKVARLLVNGWSGNAISRQLNVHHSTVYDDIAAIRDEWKKNQTQPYEVWVARELESLDHLEQAISHRLDSGDPQAIQAALRIKERRAKYLGLDTPTRYIVEDSLTAEIRELAEQIGMTDSPAVRAILDANTG